jgi:hypothetical protein
MKHEITNLAASVNQRLLNLRDLRKEDFQIIPPAKSAAEKKRFDLYCGPWRPQEKDHDG